MFRLFPKYCNDDEVVAGVYYPAGWYIARPCRRNESFRSGLFAVGLYDPEDKDATPCRFASKSDCQAAIAALTKAGFTRNARAWFEGPVLELRRIACEALPW